MEEKVRISVLLELYGKLLTEKQYEFMDYYYDITRQAVRTILLKSKKKLEEYESKLKFMQKEEKIKKYIEELEETNVDKKILKKIKQQIDF